VPANSSLKKPRRLKVFQARIGFYDTVVAAPSQADALRLWGVHQNLFAGGAATVSTDEDAVKAALAEPQSPLRRPAGSSDPFVTDPTGLPDIPAAPVERGGAARRVIHAKATSPQRLKPPTDRADLDAAEAALQALDERRAREEKALNRRRDELDQRTAEAQSAYVTARKAAASEVAEARRNYRKAGGRD
jgi:hypothetical protein